MIKSVDVYVKPVYNNKSRQHDVNDNKQHSEVAQW